jgi:hypothetical protein
MNNFTSIVAQATVQMPPVPINRETVGNAIRELRKAHRDNERKINAINKAEARLYSCLWQWNSAAQTLSVESATKTGLVRYHVERGQCECQTA